MPSFYSRQTNLYFILTTPFYPRAAPLRPHRHPEASMSSACPCPSPRHSPAHPNRNQSHRRKPKHELLQRSACAQAHQRTPSCSQYSPCHQTNNNEASWSPLRQSKRLRCGPSPDLALHTVWHGQGPRCRQGRFAKENRGTGRR